MVPFWPYTEPGSVPILVGAHLEATLVQRMLFIALMKAATLVQRMLFIALMKAAQVSPKVFLPSGWLLTHVQVNITL
jgi:hypothetical protein